MSDLAIFHQSNWDCSSYPTQSFIHACKNFWICGHENQVIILGQVRFGLHPAKLLPKHLSKVDVFGVMKAEIEIDERMHLPLLNVRLKDVPVGVCKYAQVCWRAKNI